MNINEFENQFGVVQTYSFENFWLVYFLVDDCGDIVYVGKSSSSRLGSRLLAHSRGKDFSSYFIQTGVKNEKEAYDLEGAFISMIRPKYNKTNVLVKPTELSQLSNWIVSKKEAYLIQGGDLLSKHAIEFLTDIAFFLGFAFFLVNLVIVYWYTNSAMITFAAFILQYKYALYKLGEWQDLENKMKAAK